MVNLALGILNFQCQINYSFRSIFCIRVELLRMGFSLFFPPRHPLVDNFSDLMLCTVMVVITH